MMRSFWILSFVVLLGTAKSQSLDKEPQDEQLKALNQFFGSVDRDGDGQIQPSEALSYIGANFDDAEIAGDKKDAAEWVYENLEGNDADATISKAEVEKHLKRLLKGNRVSEWLKHAAQMPQYVQAFRDNQVTSLDFPVLVSDGGRILETELGVHSKLHQEQLIRAFKRVILGIGTTPSPPQDLACQALSCQQMLISWKAPEQAGHPPMHKYKLERLLTSRRPSDVVAVPVWETANPDVDDEEVSWIDSSPQEGVYKYRLTAWNSVGWSEYAFSPNCSTAESHLPCERSATPSQQKTRQSAHDTAQPSSIQQMNLLPVLTWGVIVATLVYVSTTLLGKQSPVSQETVDISDPGVLKAHATALVRTSADPVIKSESLKSDSPLPPIGEPQQTSSRPPELGTEIVPDVRQAPSWKATKRRSSTRLAEEDCFVPGQLDSLRALSSTQRAPGEHGRQAGQSMMSEDNVVWLDDQGQEVAAPQGLEMMLMPEGGDRHKCAFPGCQKNLRVIFSPKAAMTCHYCSLCQNVFCHHHTKYSPHGMLGSCGLDSKCICHICYDDLPKLTQERLEKTNKIHRSARKDDASRMKKERSRRSLADKAGSVSGGSSNSLSAMAKSGEEHWAKLRTAWKAVKLFQGAGDERRRRTSEGAGPR